MSSVVPSGLVMRSTTFEGCTTHVVMLVESKVPVTVVIAFAVKAGHCKS